MILCLWILGKGLCVEGSGVMIVGIGMRLVFLRFRVFTVFNFFRKNRDLFY